MDFKIVDQEFMKDLEVYVKPLAELGDKLNGKYTDIGHLGRGLYDLMLSNLRPSPSLD